MDAKKFIRYASAAGLGLYAVALVAFICLASPRDLLGMSWLILGVGIAYRLTTTSDLNGEVVTSTTTREGDHNALYRVETIAAGKTVTSWVKTDANTAACNLPAGHGYSNGNFDVYWTVAGVNYCRYGVPGTISTNALSLDGGAGTDFPASATTGIVVCKQTTINTQIDGDASKAIVVSGRTVTTTNRNPIHLDFLDSGSATVAQILIRANEEYRRDIQGILENGESNPFTGNKITSCLVSNGGTTDITVLVIASLEDSTP